jgi:hypothetical protein
LPYVWVTQLLPEGWHLAFDSGDNHLMNPGVASVQIMQIGPFVAMRIVSMAMRAIHQKQMPALRSIGRQFRRLVSQPERWSKTKRNSIHISRCAQIDSNRVHFF